MNYHGTIAYRSAVGGQVEEGFCASLVGAWDFLLREGTYQVHFMRGLSCMLHESANQIAEGFRGDWVLFLDTDHVFKGDAILEMIQAFEDNKLDILCGFTQKRQFPYSPLIYKTDFDPLQDFVPIVPGVLERNVLIPIDASGLACTMVRRRVFEAIKEKLDERPFDFRLKFKSHLRGTKEVYRNDFWRTETEFDPLFVLPGSRRADEFFWEDISFFWRAKLLGFQAWCAPWVEFHHIEKRLVTRDLMK